jgi:hypothetical protein
MIFSCFAFPTSVIFPPNPYKCRFSPPRAVRIRLEQHHKHKFLQKLSRPPPALFSPFCYWKLFVLCHFQWNNFRICSTSQHDFPFILCRFSKQLHKRCKLQMWWWLQTEVLNTNGNRFLSFIFIITQVHVVARFHFTRGKFAVELWGGVGKFKWWFN